MVLCTSTVTLYDLFFCLNPVLTPLPLTPTFHGPGLLRPLTLTSPQISRNFGRMTFFCSSWLKNQRICFSSISFSVSAFPSPLFTTFTTLIAPLDFCLSRLVAFTSSFEGRQPDLKQGYKSCFSWLAPASDILPVRHDTLIYLHQRFFYQIQVLLNGTESLVLMSKSLSLLLNIYAKLRAFYTFSIIYHRILLLFRGQFYRVCLVDVVQLHF